MTWRLVYSKHAQKDATRLASAGLKGNAQALLELLAEDPYHTPPPFEKLVGDLASAHSRRINIQHRLVYQVLDDEQTVKVLRMWTHYELGAGALTRCYDRHQNRALDGGPMRSTVRFSEDVVPLGDLKVNPGKVIRHLDETGRPVLLTSRGRGVAVVQALSEFEAAQEEREFMRAVFSGLSDLEDGRELPLAEARRRLGLV